MLMLVYFSILGEYWYNLGFFLTRYEMTHSGFFSPTQPTAQFEKVIMLVVDALRYDFIYPSGNSNFSNQLLIVQECLERAPASTWLFEFVADAPTVTIQRIKGIMTGSLPTFLDFRANFHSYVIEEDNLIVQLELGNKTSVFMGDDTWINMFPSGFKRTYAFDSFNVKDLHTVDQGVMKHMAHSLKETD